MRTRTRIAVVPRGLLAVWLLLLLPATLLAQVDEGRLDAVKEFKRYWKQFKEEAQQVEAVMTLKGQECVPAAEELLKLLKHPSAVVQQVAFDVLETYRDPATYAAWCEGLPKESDQAQVAVIVKVLGRAKIVAAVPAIETAATSKKANSAVRFEAARALASIGNPGSVDLISQLLTDGDPLVRLAAADAAGSLKLASAAPALIGLLGDKEWQVQSAVIGALSSLRPQPAVQPLIDLMRHSGRLRIECAEALFRITGLDFGAEPDRWQEQWSKLMTIPGWRIPTDEELVQKAATRKKYDELYGKKEGSNTFAGIPTTSTSVLFIIDVSGSMDDLVVEVEKFQGYADRKRFTIVQTELLNTIDALTDNTNFNICAFATELDVWKPRLVAANVVNRESAKSFVKRLKPLGGTESQELAASGLGGAANLAAGKTNTLKALLYPFGVDPDKPPKAVAAGADKDALKSPLDTVYFLSDGRPSVGKIVDVNEILREVRKHNEVYRIVIHTIAIGDFQKEFLRNLAEENGGAFVDLGR